MAPPRREGPGGPAGGLAVCCQLLLLLLLTLQVQARDYFASSSLEVDDDHIDHHRFPPALHHSGPRGGWSASPPPYEEEEEEEEHHEVDGGLPDPFENYIDPDSYEDSDFEDEDSPYIDNLASIEADVDVDEKRNKLTGKHHHHHDRKHFWDELSNPPEIPPGLKALSLLAEKYYEAEDDFESNDDLGESLLKPPHLSSLESDDLQVDEEGRVNRDTAFYRDGLGGTNGNSQLPPASLNAVSEAGSLGGGEDGDEGDAAQELPQAAALQGTRLPGGVVTPGRGLRGGGLRGQVDCSICASERNLCQIISGLFTRSPLPYGYNLVTAVPAGACNVSIVESKPSKNFFALRRPDGHYVLNGEWSIEAAGQYSAGGSVFSYSPADGVRGESLIAPGPLLHPIELMIIYQSPNPGIKYEYRVPLHGISSHSPLGGYGSSGQSPGLASHAAPSGTLLGSIKPIKLPLLPPHLSSEGPAVPRSQGIIGGSIANPGGYHSTQRDHATSGAGGIYPAPAVPPYHHQLPSSGGNQQPALPRYPTYGGVPASGGSGAAGGGGGGGGGGAITDYGHQSGAVNRGRFVDPIPLYTGTNHSSGGASPSVGPPLGTGQQLHHQIRHHHNQQLVPSSSGGSRWRGLGSGGSSSSPHHGSRIAAPDAGNATRGVVSSTEQRARRRRKKTRHGHKDRTPSSGSSSSRRKARHQWVSKGFSECSKSCGGGNQSLVLVCERRRRRSKAVASKFCAGLQPPTTALVQPCNLSPCPARWVGGAWGPCSASCGIGTQSREVQCKQEVSSTYTMVVQPGACLEPSTLHTTQSCERRPCPGTGMFPPPPLGDGEGRGDGRPPDTGPLWEVGDWDHCSTDCGVGTRSRTVRCLQAGALVSDNLCYAAAGMRPVIQQLCDLGSCSPTTWFYSEWENTCSAECGTGVSRRRVYCSTDGSSSSREASSHFSGSSQQQCSQLTQPQDTRPCTAAQATCGVHWFRGQWGSCIGECGVGHKTRPVACVEATSEGEELQWRVVPDERCELGRKPASARDCRLTPCKPQWFLSDWSECSVSCGGGVMRRKTKCLTEGLQASPECPAITKPSTRQPCNLQSCGVHPSVLANVRLPDGSALVPDTKEKKTQGIRNDHLSSTEGDSAAKDTSDRDVASGGGQTSHDSHTVERRVPGSGEVGRGRGSTLDRGADNEGGNSRGTSSIDTDDKESSDREPAEETSGLGDSSKETTAQDSNSNNLFGGNEISNSGAAGGAQGTRPITTDGGAEDATERTGGSWVDESSDDESSPSLHRVSSTEGEDADNGLDFDRDTYKSRPIVIALGDESATPDEEEGGEDERPHQEIKGKKEGGGWVSSPRTTTTTVAPSRTNHDKSGCMDRMKNCHLVFRARLCRLKYYNKLCCKTCHSRGP